MLGLKLNHVSKRGHWLLKHKSHHVDWPFTWVQTVISHENQISIMAFISLVLSFTKPSAAIAWRSEFNTLRPRQNGRHFADDIFTCIFLNENASIAIKISLKCVPKGPINNIPALVQIMAWCRPGDKPLSEPMMVSLPTHMCVTRPQWVNCMRRLVWRDDDVQVS